MFKNKTPKQQPQQKTPTPSPLKNHTRIQPIKAPSCFSGDKREEKLGRCVYSHFFAVPFLTLVTAFPTVPMVGMQWVFGVGMAVQGQMQAENSAPLPDRFQFPFLSRTGVSLSHLSLPGGGSRSLPARCTRGGAGRAPRGRHRGHRPSGPPSGRSLSGPQSGPRPASP